MWLQELKELAAHNPEYQQLQQIITQGFPDHHNQLPDSCRRYWNIREHLTVDDGMIVYGCCLLIPTAMRQQALANLHDSHQGTKDRARLSIYWPGMILTMLSVHARYVRTSSHLTAKSPSCQNPSLLGHFRKLLWISAAMEDSSSSLWWIALLTGLRSFPCSTTHPNSGFDPIILLNCSL